MAQKGVSTKADYIPVNEFVRLMNWLRENKKYRWEAYMLLSFSVGLRISDFLNVTWNQAMIQGEVEINEKKTGKYRKIEISAEHAGRLSEIFDLLHLNEKHLDQPIMVNKAGAVMSSQYINAELKRIGKAFGISIKNFSTHSLRKSFARYVWEEDGCSDKALTLLSEMLNHSSISVTRRYLGITDDEIKEVYRSISLNFGSLKGV